jgi:circadian clock protein KaiC
MKPGNYSIGDDDGHGLERLKTGMSGVDGLLRGGLPKGRGIVACGVAGSGKTVLCLNYLWAGLRDFDQTGVFVAFEETPADIRLNARSFGWDLEPHEKAGTFRFLDATLGPYEEERLLDHDFKLDALRERLTYAIEQTGAKRVAIDSMAALFARFDDPKIIRREMFKLLVMLKQLGVTTLVTAELVHEGGTDITRYGIEEYVADGVILLRNRLDEAYRRRRTIEIVKLRGCGHATGEYPFSISAEGLMAMPLGTLELKQPSTRTRITSGSGQLDEMCGGGFFRDSVTIVSGATGTGKTLTATMFIAGAKQEKHNAIFFGYEESRPQLLRNAEGWGVDLEAMENDGKLKIFSQFPEGASLDQHLSLIRQSLDEHKPDRVVIDSITALSRIAGDHGFREFMLSLTSLFKERQVAALYTMTSDDLYGGNSATDLGISTLTDAIILLRYVEQNAAILRGIHVLKMRGSTHEPFFRKFKITGEGLEIGDRLEGVTKIFG